MSANLNLIKSNQSDGVFATNEDEGYGAQKFGGALKSAFIVEEIALGSI